jgi:HK97 family phage prohead protease
MDELLDFFVKPVEGHPDVLAFRHDFVLEGKALEDGGTAPTVVEEENGDLIIEGWAASFEGLDRQGENFVPGAFQRGIKAFLDGQSALCFHHQNDKGIGSVLDLQEKPEGLWMKARVDYQPESSPLRYIYNAVKKGSYKGLSVGGFFKRAIVKGRRMIADMDFTEISVTPVAMHRKTKFAVVAGKALTDGIEAETPVEPTEEGKAFEESLAGLGEALDALRARFETDDTPAVEAA